MSGLQTGSEMTRELWDLIEEYIEARLELEKVPEKFRRPMYSEPIREQKEVDRLKEGIIVAIEDPDPEDI